MFSVSARRTAVLLALFLPFGLMACGDNEDDREPSTSETPAPSTTTKTSEKPSSASPSTTKEAPSESAEAGNDNSAVAGEEEGAGEPQPANEGGAAHSGGTPQHPEALPPVRGGQPADPATADEINGLVRGMYETTTMREYVAYLPEHSCQQALEEGGFGDIDLNEIPDVPMASLDKQGWDQAYVESVDDIQVDGNEASATVRIHTAQGEDANTMRFRHEGGNWTFCNA